jgi:hypothetical protein
MKKIWVNKASSFKEAGKFDADYYLSMPEAEKLETLQLLREVHYKIRKGLKGEDRKRLRRVIKIIQ